MTGRERMLTALTGGKPDLVPVTIFIADQGHFLNQVAGAYAMLSGIDQVNVLQKGTVDDVKRATETAIKAGKAAGGGFILQPVDLLEYGTPVENVETYVKTAQEHAKY